MCFVDDMDETNAFGRGWIKKDYLEDFETYDNSEECLSCTQEESQAPEHQCSALLAFSHTFSTSVRFSP